MKTNVELVEEYLLEEKQYNTDHNIWPSKNKIIELLISRRAEMQVVYGELLRKLPNKRDWQEVIRVILSSSVIDTPTKTKELRDRKAQLTDQYKKIAATAKKLSDQIRAAEDLSNKFGLGLPEYWDKERVIKTALSKSSDEEKSYRFESYVWPKLRGLFGGFDSRYWPSNSEVIHAISVLAEQSQPQVMDGASQQSISSRKSTNADFIRALLYELENLDFSFKLSDRAIADITNCVLNLDGENLMSDEQVKAIRHR